MKRLSRKRIGIFLRKCLWCNSVLIKSQDNVIEAVFRHWHFPQISLTFCSDNPFYRGICFFSVLSLGPTCRTLAPRPLGPPNFIVAVSRIGWYDRDEVLKFSTKNVVIFKNTTYIINRGIFRVLLVQGIFST